MRSSARLRKSFANVGVARADRKRQGFDFVATLRIRVVRGVSAATARGAVTAGVCRTPASLWNRDDTIEAVSEALRMPAEGAGPTVTPIADGRERVLRRFANMFFEHVFQGECACPPGSLRIPVKPITDSGVKPITQSGQADHLSERSDAGVRLCRSVIGLGQ